MSTTFDSVSEVMNSMVREVIRREEEENTLRLVKRRKPSEEEVEPEVVEVINGRGETSKARKRKKVSKGKESHGVGSPRSSLVACPCRESCTCLWTAAWSPPT